MTTVRERILETASELFYQKGIQAVGVDAIIGQADVARMSFYRHFKSKEGLVLACLDARDERFRTWLAREVNRFAPDPKDRPLAVFDALALRFATKDYRGCAFLNTMAETADRENAVHRAAAAHKGKIGTYFEGLLRDAGLDAWHAADLLLLFDGAVVSAVREGSITPAARAKRLAALLLNTPLQPSAHPSTRPAKRATSR